MYMIKVSENISGKVVSQTRHFCEIRLATTSPDEAEDILRTIASTWPIECKDPKSSFTFKLVKKEEFDLLKVQG